jgi:chemotaxis protein methyltransferase WspC
MNVARVESLIRDRLGLDPAAVGLTVLPQAIQRQMQAHKIATPELYQEYLDANPKEIAVLAADLVVPETWFFRGGLSLFQRLAQCVADCRRNQEADERVRILSLPCSTGEEPYSLAISLNESGLPANSYQIEAVDLSPLHLEKALAAVYSAFAFREPLTDLQARYFSTNGNSWKLRPAIRNSVSFRVGNLTEPSFLSQESSFDLILCRNLFIYLTYDGRLRSLETLDRLLGPDGYLCVTPAEADRLPAKQFVAEGPTEFGLYRRVDRGISTPPSETNPTRDAIPTTPLPQTPRLPATPETPTKSHPRPESNSPEPSLDEARLLANSGNLSKARLLCEDLLQTRRLDPELHSLLGVLHQAEGRTSEAVEAFRRALYLDPNLVEALTHMIVLSDSRGDASQAANLQKRLQRLTSGDKA